MSQSHAKPGLQMESKRARAAEVAGSEADSDASEDRSVRQRTDSLAPLPAGSSAASSASSSSAASHAITAIRLSLMRLAVVERQLIMQGLDITSLARLASTCKQLRGEALHKEAGKFIPRPKPRSSLGHQCDLDGDCPSHASPLFLAHMPVQLTLDEFPQELAQRVVEFSRVNELTIEPPDRSRHMSMHSAEVTRTMQLLAHPCMQRLSIAIVHSHLWLQTPAIQQALFALPCLSSVELSVAEPYELLESNIAPAARLVSLKIFRLRPHHVRGLRALRLSPSLTHLTLSPNPRPLGRFYTRGLSSPVSLKSLWPVIPPSLTSLELRHCDVSRDVSRSVFKAFFQRVPKLQKLELWMMVMEPFLQGMLDAKLDARPMQLQRVEFSQEDDSYHVASNLLRRFLHRFPAVIVRFGFLDPTHAGDYLARCGGWPRVEVRVGSRGDPPSPHASDDESGTDVSDMSEQEEEQEAES